jgi:hypothetical protein
VSGGEAARPVRRAPLYARVLRLRRLRPGPVLCFVFLEGSVAFAVLLALAGLASWWTVLALPVAVAVMVKVNDLVAAATTRAPKQTAPKTAPKKEPPAKPPWPLPGNPAKPLIIEDTEDVEEPDVEEPDTEEPDVEEPDTEEPDTEGTGADEEDEGTEKTGSPEATRSTSG